jgi:hypothetical protein
MRDATVIVFGAGATKDCGGPLTNEILPEAIASQFNLALQKDSIDLLKKFLDDCFMPAMQSQLAQDYPGLPLLLSLLDTAIDRKEPMGSNWPTDELAKVRQAIEAAIFSVLDFPSPQGEATSYARLLELAFPHGQPSEAIVISLNYDLILDMAMFDLCNARKPNSVPSYGCDIKTEAYQSRERWGKLLKLHGSVNWMYCSQCHHLEIGWSSRGGVPRSIGNLFFRQLEDQYSHRAQCPECQTQMRPILITPTHRKDYRNPHLARIWYEAERALQQANRVIFVGYSLPDDDVEVIYLLKRNLTSWDPVPPPQITVIEKDDSKRPIHVHPVGQRYRALFGKGIDFHVEGFSDWLTSCVPGLPPPPSVLI